MLRLLYRMQHEEDNRNHQILCFLSLQGEIHGNTHCGSNAVICARCLWNRWFYETWFPGVWRPVLKYVQILYKIIFKNTCYSISTNLIQNGVWKPHKWQMQLNVLMCIQNTSVSDTFWQIWFKMCRFGTLWCLRQTNPRALTRQFIPCRHRLWKWLTKWNVMEFPHSM